MIHEMHQKELAALQEIMAHYYDAELQDYENSDDLDKDIHIFNALNIIENWLKEQRP